MYNLEIESLRKRVAELEEENEVLRKEALLYLSKWIAAQDLAAMRQVLMLVQQEPTPKTE